MSDFLTFVLILGGTTLLSWPLGKYLAAVLEPGPRVVGARARVEGLFARIAGPSRPRRRIGRLTCWRCSGSIS